MISDLPIYVYLVFAIAIVFVIIMFYYASNKSYKFTVGIILYGIVHSTLVFSGFYETTHTMPPRFLLIGFPMILIVIISLVSKNVKNWYSKFDIKLVTLIHSVRILVELVLFWLFLSRYVPEVMTFEGRNFDILAGITAPIVAYFAFRNGQVNKRLLWFWNIASILLLFNILIHATLSVPTVFQLIEFDQPNIAIMKFPFVLLPVIIVPLVLISNMAAFELLKNNEKDDIN